MSERALRPSNAKKVIYRRKNTELGEIEGEKNRIVERKTKGTVLLLSLTFTLQPV